MNQIVLTGMVLSTTPVGEYDRRVVILTKEQGKISAFARGARKPNSPLVGAVNPFSFGEFTIYAGRTSYTIQSAKISNYFAELREDIVGAYYGFYFLEFANYYTKEANDEREMLKLLYQTLRALCNPKIPNKLIRYIFELRALYINGEGAQVFGCVTCGCKDRPMVFSVKKGGLICSECGGDVIDGIRLDQSTIYLFIIGGDVSEYYEEFSGLVSTRARVMPATLRNYAGLVGAARYAYDRQAS